MRITGTRYQDKTGPGCGTLERELSAGKYGSEIIITKLDVPNFRFRYLLKKGSGKINGLRRCLNMKETLWINNL